MFKIYLGLLVVMLVTTCVVLFSVGIQASAAMARSDATLERIEDQATAYRSAVTGLRRARAELVKDCEAFAPTWRQLLQQDLALRRKRGE